MGIYKFDFENLSSEELENTDILQFLNHVLFEVAINTGELVCNNCGRIFPINDGVPNMILGDDEV